MQVGLGGMQTLVVEANAGDPIERIGMKTCLLMS